MLRLALDLASHVLASAGQAHDLWAASAHRLKIRLQHIRAGNAVLVKLVDQENLMAEFEDAHEAPNIDVSHVIFNGNHIMLPDGVALSC